MNETASAGPAAGSPALSAEASAALADTASEPWGPTEFRRLLEYLPAAAYTCNATGLITYFNAQACEVWGRAPRLHDPIDRYCGSFKLFSCEGEPIKHDQCWMARAILENRGFNGEEIVIERPDGRRLTALAHANPIYDAAGKLAGAVNVLVDITERKRMERALQQADRAKDRFLATLAHELRNPLAPIARAVDLLRLESDERDRSRWAADVIGRQVHQLSRLIDDLMDVSRITGNKLRLNRQSVPLTDIIATAVEATQPLVDAREQQLTITLPSRSVSLDADPVRIAQVISNLLNNAAKYTPTGGHIRLTGEVQQAMAVLTIKDSGIGIPPDKLQQIFEMFIQLDDKPECQTGGLGIGLTLVKLLVEMHGGTVEARSAGEQQGSRFVVRLPIATEKAQTRHGEPALAQVAPGMGRRVLVVDDNEDAAAALEQLLRELGNETRVANSGEQALSIAAEFSPDTVVLDIGLPGISGHRVAHELRERPGGEDLLLIALTGWGQDDDRLKSSNAGFDHHLVKPADARELIGLLSIDDGR